jgi:hypothetical protein
MPNGARLIQRPRARSEQVQFWSEHLDGQEDPVIYAKLREALAEHIWNSKAVNYVGIPKARVTSSFFIHGNHFTLKSQAFVL